MKNIFLKITLKFTIIIIYFVTFISGIYLWILPQFFNSYKTPFFMMAGVGASVLLGGYYGYKTANIIKSVVVRYLLASLAGLFVGGLVLFFSLLIIVNIVGE